MSQTPKTIQIRLAIEAFLLDCQARRLRPHTVRYYRNELRQFTACLASVEIQTLQDITATHIRAYMVGREEKGLKPASVHASARAVRAWLNFCVREELISVSPFNKVKMPKVEIETLPAFTAEQVNVLLDACTEHRDRAIILCLLDSGNRANEFLGWDWGDINLSTGVVHVRKTKNRKERVSYLGKRALKVLTVLYAIDGGDPDSPVWRNLRTGERLHYWGLKQLFKRLQITTGVRCHAHKFRRTFALWSLRAGMDVFSLQRLLGHKDLTVVKRYLDLVQSDLKDAHDRFGPVDNMGDTGKKKSDRF